MCTYAHVVITSTWHLTCGLVNVSYRYSTSLCFHENCHYCHLVVCISCVWAATILLCFCGAIGCSILFTFVNSCIMELPRCLSICVGMGVLPSGCAVHFNPWYKTFISGLRSHENQPLWGWLIVKLFPCLWVKKYKWSCWNPFYGLQ